MSPLTQPSFTIGLIAPDDQLSQMLSDELQRQQIQIHYRLQPNQLTEQHIEIQDIDIWLVSIDDDDWNQHVDALLDHSVAPLFFNEHSALASSLDWQFWCYKLIQRLKKVIDEATELPSNQSGIASVEAEINDDKQKSCDHDQSGSPALEFEIWVFGSSFGGPAALKRFFDALPKVNFPVAIVLVQHIDQGHMTALKDIICSSNHAFDVAVVEQSAFLRPGAILIAPYNSRLTFVPNGLVVATDERWTRPFAPNVNDVIADVALCYPKNRGGVIIFSGLSNDGCMHLDKVAENGWKIWAQDSQSCTNSSMPDASRETGLVQLSDTPTALSQHFYTYFKQQYPTHMSL